MRRDKLGKIHQIVLGLALGLAFIVTVEALSMIDDGVEIRLFHGGEHRWTMTYHDGQDRVKVKSRGDVELVEKGQVMSVEVGAGGRFFVDAKEDGERRRLTIRTDDSGVRTVDYQVDGRDREMDDNARAWLSDVLLAAVRRGGFDAKARAVRYYDEHGIEGFLTEIEQLGGDEVRRRYVIAVMDRGELPPADLSALLAGAARSISGDHTMMQILHSVSPEALAVDAVASAYLAAAGSISGDHTQRRVLSHVLNAELSEATWNELFKVAEGIDSDHEAARLVVEWASAGRSSLPASLPAFIGAIASDHEQRRAITSVLEGPVDQAARGLLLQTAAAHLDSDHEASSLLRFHVSFDQGAVSEPSLALLSTISGDHAQMQAAVAMAEHADPGELLPLIERTDLSSHSLAELLRAITDRVSPEEAPPELRDAVRREASRLGEPMRQRLSDEWLG